MSTVFDRISHLMIKIDVYSKDLVLGTEELGVEQVTNEGERLFPKKCSACIEPPLLP
jgi:hypothetical protein